MTTGIDFGSLIYFLYIFFAMFTVNTIKSCLSRKYLREIRFGSCRFGLTSARKREKKLSSPSLFCNFEVGDMGICGVAVLILF